MSKATGGTLSTHRGRLLTFLYPHPTQTSGPQGPEDIRITWMEDGDYPSRILHSDGYLMLSSDLSLSRLYVFTLRPYSPAHPHYWEFQSKAWVSLEPKSHSFNSYSLSQDERKGKREDFLTLDGFHLQAKICLYENLSYLKSKLY